MSARETLNAARPVSPGSRDEPDRPTLDLGFGVVMEYVSGGSPYYWIGTAEKGRMTSISADYLRRFVMETFTPAEQAEPTANPAKATVGSDKEAL